MSTQVIRFPRPGSDKIWFRFAAQEISGYAWVAAGDGVMLMPGNPSTVGDGHLARFIRREDFFSVQFPNRTFAPFFVKAVSETLAAATAAYQEALKLDEQAKADLVCDELQDVLSNDVVKRKLVERGLRITALEAELAQAKRKVQELRYLQPLAQWAAKVFNYMGTFRSDQNGFALYKEYMGIVETMKEDGHEVKL